MSEKKEIREREGEKRSIREREGRGGREKIEMQRKT